MLVNIIR